MRPWMTGLLGAAVGAVLTAVLFTATGDEVGAAEGASPTRDERAGTGTGTGTGDTRGWDGPSAGTRAAAGDPATAPSGGDEGADETRLDVLTPAALKREHLVVLRENHVLHEQVAALQAQVAALQEGGAAAEDRPETYDLSPGQLAKMAQSCELRWDMPSLTELPPSIPAGDISSLGLRDNEVAIVNEQFALSHARLVEVVRATYAQLTGDDTPGSMSPEAMYAEISDKSAKEELQRIFRQLSHERAGLLQPPADLSALPPVEQMYRVLTTEGDALEQSLAEQLGADLAAELRNLHNGWNSKFRSTHGCP